VIALTVVAAGKKIAPGAAVSAPGETAPAATEARSVRFKYADDGLIETASFQGEADSSASVFLFRGIQGAPTMSYAGRSATETRTNRTGTVTAVYDYTFFKNKLLVLTGRTEEGADEDLLRFDYDSFGRVVSVASPDYQAEALYDAVGRPVYWRIRGGIEGEGTDSFQRTYQWDERGLLVRERVSVDDGWSEFRYEYSFDSSGNWVERRSTKWEMRFGSLVSEPGPRLFRAIRYR
jgi:YD repeat-containing protein